MELPLVLFMVFTAATCHISQVEVPSFWWDIAEGTSYISDVITVPDEQYAAFNDSKSRLWYWDLDWAEGLSITWTDDEGRWTAWLWNSTVLPGMTGAGFLYNVSTEKGDGHTGASWIREQDGGPLVWNCFRIGDLIDPLPWLSWRLRIKDTLIGFMTNGGRWGFMTDKDRIWSRHCNRAPSVGKRYQVQDGQEVARHVKKDPSAGTYSLQRNRVRRSPSWEGFKKFFTDMFAQRPGQQNGEPQDRGEACLSLWDSFVKFMKWMFGWEDKDGSPGSGTPGDGASTEPTETVANQESRKDRESLDPKQNEAAPDWE